MASASKPRCELIRRTMALMNTGSGSSHLDLDANAMVQTLGPLTTSPPKRTTPGATPRSIAPQNQRTFNPLPLVALAGLAGLGFVVWSNASELTRFAQGLKPANPTLEPSETDLEVTKVADCLLYTSDAADD